MDHVWSLLYIITNYSFYFWIGVSSPPALASDPFPGLAHTDETFDNVCSKQPQNMELRQSSSRVAVEL